MYIQEIDQFPVNTQNYPNFWPINLKLHNRTDSSAHSISDLFSVVISVVKVQVEWSKVHWVFCINCNTLQNNNFYHWHFWQLEFFVLFLSKITATFSGSFMNTPISFENQSNFDHQTWNSTTELTLLPSDQFRANLFNGINAGALSDLGARHRPRLARR